jgi:hypothetical protein
VSLQSKLVSYFSRQLSYKKKVSLQERNAELDGFPQLRHWFRIVDVRKEVLEVTRGCPVPFTLSFHTHLFVAAWVTGFWPCTAQSLAQSEPEVKIYWKKTGRIFDASVLDS